MKKTLALIAILALVVGSLFAATPVDSGVLNVYGKIGTGDVNFVVNGVEYTRVDLRDDARVQVAGAGVQIGSWTMSAANQVSGTGYTVTYTYGPLTSGATTIDFIILEINELPEPDVTTDKVTTATTALSMSAGANSITRKIAFKLTSDGVTQVASAPAANTYNSVVTIALSAD
jgi:hypothetical protein